MSAIPESTIWSYIIKFANVIVIAIVIPWAIWTTNSLFRISERLAVMDKIQEQIRLNTDTIGRHEKQLATTDTALAALVRELMPLESRVRLFVTRAEWDLRNETRDRELNAIQAINSEQHANIMAKLDRLLERHVAKE
jgi:hypothetical protein